MLARLLLRSTLRFCSTGQVERPFTPSLWNSMTISQLQRLPQDQQLQGLIHAVGLMQVGITPFDYDFYQWSCGRVIEQQQRLQKEEITLMLRLAAKYRVTPEPFQKHIENQLFLRIHRDYQGDVQQYDENLKRDFEECLRNLEKQSMDYFNILNQGQTTAEVEENVEKQSEETQDVPVVSTKEKKNTPNEKKESHNNNEQKQIKNETQKFVVQMNKKLAKRNKTKQFSLQDVAQVMGLLRETGSKNLPLLQYLLKLLTIHYESGRPISPQGMLQYVSGLTYVCQSLMAEYSLNRQRYTPRSLKRIFKFQTLYYHEHLRQLPEALPQLTQGELQELIKIYGGFMLKRREIRRRIGGMVGEEMKKRGLVGEAGIVKEFIGINGKDEKMKKSYCQFLGLDLEKAKEIGLYQEKAPKLIQQQSKVEQQQEQTAEGKEEVKEHI